MDQADATVSILLIIALVFGFGATTFLVVRMLRMKDMREPTSARGSRQYGVLWAFTTGMLPWNKESGRLHPVVFWVGVVYHIGLFAAGLILLQRLFVGVQATVFLKFLGLFSGIGIVVAMINFIRRYMSAELRELSVLDDYISVALTVLFMHGAWAYSYGVLPAGWFDFVTILLAVYLPFSKIKHMVTFFISRYYHGAKMGTIGVYSPEKAALVTDDLATMRLEALGMDDDEEGGAAGEAKEGEERRSDPFRLSNEEKDKLIKAIGENTGRRSQAMINACVHCGMCAEACHYYLATDDRSLIPVAKLDKLADVFKKYYDPIASRLPILSGVRELAGPDIAELHQTAFEQCSICGRCELSCPMGINTGEVLMGARAAFCAIGKSNKELENPAKTAAELGNYAGLEREDFVDTLEWVAEELEDDIDDDNFSIPIDKEGARVLFMPHPLELRDFPMLLMAIVKVFHKAGEDYTFSSEYFDTTNYAYYAGNKKMTSTLIKKIMKAQEKTGSKVVAMSPCGHGYKVLRWEAEKIYGRKLPFEVVSFAELLDGYIRDKKIKLKKDVVEGPLTYHDPCNTARHGGIIEEPRRVIREMTSKFVEMTPSGAYNFCCGGGGGLAANPDYGKTRLKVGEVKVEQLRRTKAKVVVTNCFNCTTQIKALAKKHSLEIEVKPITEMVAESLE